MRQPGRQPRQSGNDADISAAALFRNHFQLFRSGGGNVNHAHPITFGIGAGGGDHRQIEILTDVGRQHHDIALVTAGFPQPFDRIVQRPVQAVAVFRHDVGRHRPQQIVNYPSVFGKRADQKRFIGINDQPALRAGKRFQQVGNGIFGPRQTVGRHVGFIHVGRKVQKKHNRIFRRKNRNFPFLPAGTGQRDDRPQHAGQQQPRGQTALTGRAPDQQKVQQLPVTDAFPGRDVLHPGKKAETAGQRHRRRQQPPRAKEMKSA